MLILRVWVFLGNSNQPNEIKILLIESFMLQNLTIVAVVMVSGRYQQGLAFVMLDMKCPRTPSLALVSMLQVCYYLLGLLLQV